ncbi:hydroxylaminobenzene mutase [Bradyrhizobium sp. AZCC 2262]|uniref:hypothetical protein n=1 Tax=Bradyrhizobium sp. AZCC 2262 TaxID=3117022 RepID=UPI002FEF3681
MAQFSATLCFTGLLLFLFGLVLGFGVPALASPRLAVAAHVAGMQSGVALLAIGLLWPHLHFWNGWSAPTAHALWVSLYVIFVAQAMSAVWAAGRSLPVAGGGTRGLPWQESLVHALLVIGSIGTTAAIVAILLQWIWAGS